MASALLGPLCQRVINPVYEEYKLVNNVNEEIKKLRFTVSLIEGVLQDAEDRQVKEQAVGNWLRSLRQVLYDAEDILDKVATAAALQTTEVDDATSLIGKIAKVCELICGSINKFLNSRDIVHQIEAIRMKLDYISKEKDKLGLQVSDKNNWVEASRARRLDSSSMLADESYIIGRDDEKKQIIQWLMGCGVITEPTSSKRSVDVLSVIGMGGVGKTTLTKLVYNDPLVKQYFQLHMWVCISNDFDLKRIVKEIVDGKESCETSNWDATQKRLKDKIEGKRFLLVLDDVWEEDPSKWEYLCELLKYGGEGSKIIVTTRSRKVSEIMKGTPILLKSLSSEYLWSVFERYAFDGCDSNKHMQLATVGRQVVEKLKGSPLAAKTIGRLLNTNLDKKYWKHIMKSEISLLPEHESDIMPILKLSYNHLTGHLKQCFAYYSLFPKDHEFYRNELVQLWTAQNFVQIRRGSHVESVGSEQIFDDLQYKSFFEQSRPGIFVMHDLIHDLAELVSEDDCFRLEGNNPRRNSETARHVSIATDNFDLVNFEELCEHKSMRTLLFLGDRRFQLGPHLDNLFMKLQRLRVLGLSWCDIEELPTSIGTLKHLRFLDLSWTRISKLPESLCNLHNLQVLNLENCRRLRILPSNMSALINLRHLDADSELVYNIQGLGKLTALQELNVRGRQVRELAAMGFLRKLKICELEEVQSKEAAIQARLDEKEHLDLMNPRLDEEVLEGLKPADSINELSISNYGGAKSPSWMDDQYSWVSFSCLERVKLVECRNWEVLPPLGQLSGLKELLIRRMANVRQIDPQFLGCCADGVGDKVQGWWFPSLEELRISDMPAWEEWEVPHGDDGEDNDGGQKQQQPLLLPHLRILEITDCPMLRQLPPLPPTLTHLRIRDVELTRLPGWSPSSLSSSPSLSSLSITSCPNLTSLSDGLLQLPLQKLQSLPSSLVYLCIGEDHHLDDETLSACLRGLTSLSDLSISDCTIITSLPGAEVLSHITALRRLHIRRLKELTSLGGIHSLVSLEVLSIDDCPELLHTAAPTVMEHLRRLDIYYSSPQQIKVCLLHCASLHTLEIRGCSQLTGFDGEVGGDIGRELEAALLNLAPSLRSLKFWRCENLRFLPPKLRCLCSLKELHIEICPQIQSLPAAGLPESLEYLSISECPALKERYQEGGPDWPLISHIPRVECRSF